jgi:hypothetical protein
MFVVWMSYEESLSSSRTVNVYEHDHSMKNSALSRSIAPVLGAGAIGVCPLCWAGSAAFLTYIGLAALIPIWQGFVGVLLLIGLIGLFFDYRAHKDSVALIAYILGAILLYFGRYVFGMWPVWGFGGIILIGAVIANRRHFQKKQEALKEQGNTSTPEKAMLTCPKCGHEQQETIPVGSCLPRYTCGACEETIQAKDDDCCVFCSYADTACPVGHAE